MPLLGTLARCTKTCCMPHENTLQVGIARGRHVWASAGAGSWSQTRIRPVPTSSCERVRALRGRGERDKNGDDDDGDERVDEWDARVWRGPAQVNRGHVCVRAQG